jgi:hypothetical protein
MDLPAVIAAVVVWELLRYAWHEAFTPPPRDGLEECPRCGVAVPDLYRHLRRCSSRRNRHATEHVSINIGNSREELPP